MCVSAIIHGSVCCASCAPKHVTVSGKREISRGHESLLRDIEIPRYSVHIRTDYNMMSYVRFYKINNVSCEIDDLSKLMFASCVGYFDRTYYGFYVTSSRMFSPSAYTLKNSNSVTRAYYNRPR